MMAQDLDAIYVTASAQDGRFTRICVASIRHFYPKVAVRVLAGGPLEPGLEGELASYWAAPTAEVRRGDWGWGFVKLEPLFGRPGERFLVVDSDTVFAGPVLEILAGCKGNFLVDDEQQTEAETLRLYYDWRKVAAVDSTSRPPQFVFNSGQWFGTAGILDRRDFEQFVDWGSMPPRLRWPDLFMPGDQGVLNYVLNQKAQHNGLAVDRRPIMRWPGHGMDAITATSVAGRTAPPLIVHWAGFKAARLADLPGADVLRYFERLYYARLPKGERRRRVASVIYPVRHCAQALGRRVRLRLAARVTTP